MAEVVEEHVGAHLVDEQTAGQLLNVVRFTLK
jgi:hypothetical protein